MKIDYTKYYKEIARVEVDHVANNELKCKCLFHDDATPSMSINIDTGLWKCFGCGEGGNIFQFHSKLFEIPISKTSKAISIAMGEYKIINDIQLIYTWHKNLLAHSKIMEHLIKARGLTLEIIKKFELGYEQETKRITIPVYDDEGYLVNIRKYAPNINRESDCIKFLSYGSGYGGAKLFPSMNITNKTEYVLLTEGELDCMLANKLGYNSITVTGGAGSWTQEFTNALVGKVVFICYDIDTAGVKGAITVANALCMHCRVKIINLPISDPPNGDLTDYIVGCNKTSIDLDLLIANTSWYENPRLPQAETRVDNKTVMHDVPLITASNKDYYYKNVRMKTIVCGKDLAPYFAPKKVLLTCKAGTRLCKLCPMSSCGGKMELNITTDTHDILQLINCTDMHQRGYFRQMADLPQRCTSFKVAVTEVYNIEELRVIPEIDYVSSDTEYVTRNVYYVGSGARSNRAYLMEGITVPDPVTQYATQIIKNIIPVQTSIDQFNMTDELLYQLQIFQIEEESLNGVMNKVADITDDLTYNVTKMYGRQDLIVACDLVYHSVLSFDFIDKRVLKGYTEALVIGDTRCGKSETFRELLCHYKLGELCTGENISYAGLVGGMSQNQNRWSIAWGKIPINDRRLVILDEASSLPIDTISNLSGLRSSGIAEIIKIQTERTTARTRLIWGSNTRSGRKLDTYNYGVLAIRELIGRLEDIARFDLAVTCASSEVSINEINTAHHPKVEHKYTSELCNKLVLWAWSRSASNVHFTNEAIDTILKYATEFGAKYTSTVPLVEASEMRIKLARLSVAIACRLFSTHNGQDVIIKKHHVDFIAAYLDGIYSKESMAYDTFSKVQVSASTISDDKIKELSKDFKDFPNHTTLKELLLEFHMFRKVDLQDQMGYTLEETRMLFKWLSKNKLIKSYQGGYVKQPILTKLLKHIKEAKDKIIKDSQFKV